MRLRGCAATVLLITLTALTSPAGAQERKGFWLDADIGVGTVGISAGNFDDSRIRTGVFGLAAGWALNPQVLVGFDSRITVFDITGPIPGTVNVYNVGARVAYYPSRSRGAFVKGIIGGSFVDLEIERSGTRLTANVGKGFGAGGGVGYDWYLGKGFALTPAVTYWYGRAGDFRFVGQTFFPDWRHNILDATIGVSFH